MSDQNREMAYGYIMKAMIDTGASTSILREIYLVSREEIKGMIDESANDQMNNYSTGFVFNNALREIEKDNEYIKQAMFNLYNAFDRISIEEAEELYHAFSKILK